MDGVHEWVLLHYKIPREPSAPRVYVWRKLKRLGALLLQDAVWVLPATARTREEFEWLAVEIGEQGGEASVWEGHLTLAGQDEALVRQFLAQVEAEYAALRDAVARPDANFSVLSRRYQQVQGQDYFQSAVGQQVRAALLTARGEQDA